MSNRCPDCGYAVRSDGHKLGPQHTGGTVGKRGTAVVKARPRRFKAVLTKPKRDGHGYDFHTIKRSGLR